MDLMVCLECGREYVYDRRKGHKKNKCNSCMVNWRRKFNKQRAIEYKGGKCVICGYSRCMRSLSFHHIEGHDKHFSFSRYITFSWEKLQKELDKCILVCANCHGEIHEGLIKFAAGNSAA